MAVLVHEIVPAHINFFSLKSLQRLIPPGLFSRGDDPGNNPDSGVYIPEFLRACRKAGGILSRLDCEQACGLPGMGDLSLRNVCAFLDGEQEKQIKFLTAWSSAIFQSEDPYPHAPRELELQHLSLASRDEIALRKIGLVFRPGPHAFFRRFQQLLAGQNANALPIFQAYSGLLGLRAFLVNCRDQRINPSFAIYLPHHEKGILENQSRLLYFSQDSHAFQGEVCSYSTGQDILAQKPLLLVDDVVQSGESLQRCKHYLRNMVGDRLGEITHVSYALLPSIEDDSVRYMRWLRSSAEASFHLR